MDNWSTIILLEVGCIGLFFLLDMMVNKVRGMSRNYKISFIGASFITFLFIVTDMFLVFLD